MGGFLLVVKLAMGGSLANRASRSSLNRVRCFAHQIVMFFWVVTVCFVQHSTLYIYEFTVVFFSSVFTLFSTTEFSVVCAL